MKRKVSALRILMALMALCMVLFAGAVTVAPDSEPSEMTQNPWPMFRGDLKHTGSSPAKAPDTNHTKWVFPTSDPILSSAAIVDGKVFVSCDDFNLYCIDINNGQEIWHFPAGNRIRSSPAVADGKVFFGSDSTDNRVYCVDVTTHNEVWNYSADGAVVSSPAIWNGRVYVGTNSGRLLCLNENTGSEFWNYSCNSGAPPNAVYSSPAVTGGRVFFGSHDKNLYCLNATTKAVIWHYLSAGEITSSPAVVNGKVFFGTFDYSNPRLNCVYAIPENDPNSDGVISENEVLWNYTAGDLVYPSPAVSDHKVFIGSKNRKLYCLDETNGAMLWNYTTGFTANHVEQNGFISSPAVADGKVYVNAWNRSFYCFDADGFSDGTDDGVPDSHVNNSDLIWSYRLSESGDGGVCSPAIADGMVFIGSGVGNLYCFGPASAPEFPVIAVVIVTVSAIFIAAEVRAGRDSE